MGSSSVSATGTYAASANSHQPRDTTNGEVRLLGAKVGGVLSARGSTFQAAMIGMALLVQRRLFLRGGATFNGEVILLGAKVGGILDASGFYLPGRPEHGQART